MHQFRCNENRQSNQINKALKRIWILHWYWLLYIGGASRCTYYVYATGSSVDQRNWVLQIIRHDTKTNVATKLTSNQRIKLSQINMHLIDDQTVRYYHNCKLSSNHLSFQITFFSMLFLFPFNFFISIENNIKIVQNKLPHFTLFIYQLCQLLYFCKSFFHLLIIFTAKNCTSLFLTIFFISEFSFQSFFSGTIIWKENKRQTRQTGVKKIK